MHSHTKFYVLRRDWPFPFLSTFLENCNGRFHQQTHQRRAQIPLGGVFGHDVQPVDGEQTVRGKHHANEDGAKDGEAFSAHGRRQDMPLFDDNSDSDALVMSRCLLHSLLPINQLKTE